MSAAKKKRCGASIDASDLPCVREAGHDLSDQPDAVRHRNASGLEWNSIGRALLDAASPTMASALRIALDCRSIVAGVCGSCRSRARAALRKAGRLP